MNVIKKIEAAEVERLSAERAVPDFDPGDTLKVNVKVIEGTRERIQAYEGVCIAKKAKASTPPSPCAKSLTAKASSGCSHSIPPVLRRSK